MIIKSLSRKSNSSQLVKYIFRYVLDDEKKKEISKNDLVKSVQPNFIIRHNVRSRSVKGYVKEFQENEAYRIVRRKDSVQLFHTIISFAPGDSKVINDKLLKDIAKKFISERGLNNLYVGTKHEDKNHVHLHLAISGCQTNGRSSRISKQQFHHIKLELDRYQKEKYPKLIHSLPEHGKANKKITKEQVIENVKQSRQTHKEKLCSILASTYKKASSTKQFLVELESLGHQAYYRNGKLQGLMYEGKKFRLNRLGYDEAVLQTLDQEKIQEDKVLVDLQNLRKQNVHELEKEEKPKLPETESMNAEEEQEAEMLNELSVLRNDTIEKESPVISTPSDYQEVDEVGLLSSSRNKSLTVEHEIEER